MKRTLIAFSVPAALVAALTMAHCSSSSSTGTGDAGSGTGSGTGKGTGTGTGTGKGSGSGSSSGTGTGTGSGSSAPAYDGGSVGCGDAACAVPANVCCETKTGSGTGAVGVETCQPETMTCGGTNLGCVGSANCPSTGNTVCCLNATGTDTAKLSCEAPSTGDAGACGAGGGLASAQICETNTECTSGNCGVWVCTATTPPTVLHACYKPVGILGASCTLQTTDAGSGTGSGTGTGTGSGTGTGTGSGT